MEKVRILEVKQSVFANNDAQAEKLREELKQKGIYLLNLMSSPGSGKTTTLTRLIELLKEDLKIGVMEADIDSDVDAVTIAATGAKAIQLHTGGMCHLDAAMTRQGLDGLDAGEADLVVLENVGNLVCPAEFDTGAVKNMAILSVPEGHDKPLKYPLMFQVCDAEIDIIKAMGVEIKCGIEVGKDVTLDELRAQGYKAFYIAIGCQGGRKAGIPGEDAEGVMTAVDFLRTVGADESYPVTGKAVVVGGGNVAIDVARTAQRCGAESVAMFCLEPRDKMPASEEEIAEALEEDVTIDCGWGPKEILTENGRVTGIVFRRCVSVWDKDGKFAPAYDENDTKTVPCDRVFLSIGQSILWGDLLKGSKVELGRGNGAVADSLTYQTAEPDIFVGGDVYTGPKFAIDAIAAGREGAISIHRFVQPHSSLTIGRNRREFIALDKDNIKVEQYDNASRQIPGTRKDVDHKKSFRDAKLPFTEEQVKAETARCLGCGASVVDPNKCIGCGVCTTKCEFGAIKLHRERPECSNMIPSEKKLPYVLGNGAKQALKIKFSKKKEQ